jgi:hypothetical protein
VNEDAEMNMDVEMEVDEPSDAPPQPPREHQMVS